MSSACAAALLTPGRSAGFGGGAFGEWLKSPPCVVGCLLQDLLLQQTAPPRSHAALSTGRLPHVQHVAPGSDQQYVNSVPYCGSPAGMCMLAFPPAVPHNSCVASAPSRAP